MTSMPKTIGRYEIRSELGRSNAIVYRGYDPLFDREVAIKVLPHNLMLNDTVRQRFDREARAFAKLEHEAIVPVYDVGEVDNQPYIVMRLMQETLVEKARANRLSIDQTLRIMRRIASALAAAHHNNIVHRDVKPGNILFDQYGNAFLADLGIVHLPTEKTLTQDNSVIGTPPYMSPEQAQGRRLDGRSDIYSLGVVFYELLAYIRPFEADTISQWIFKHISEPPVPLEQHRPDIDPAIRQVVMRCLAKSPTERYTAQQLVQALEQLRNRTAANIPPPTIAATQQTQPSRPSWLIYGIPIGAIVLALGVFFVLRALGGGNSPTPTPTQDIANVTPTNDESGASVPVTAPVTDPTETAEATSTIAVTETSAPTLTPTIESTPTEAPAPEIIVDFSTIESAVSAFSGDTLPQLAIAYSGESGPYSYNNVAVGNDPRGYEVALLEAIFERWGNGESIASFASIRVTDREPCAMGECNPNICPEGRCDVVIGAITGNERRCSPSDDRRAIICTNTVHATDRLQVLLNLEVLRETNGSEFFETDLNVYCEYFFEDKPVGVIGGTTAEAVTSNLFDRCVQTDSRNFDIVQVQDFQSRDQVVAAILSNTIAGYFTDSGILRFYASQSIDPDNLVVRQVSNFVGVGLENYTYMLPEGHEGLRDLMDLTMQAMVCDGGYAELYTEFEPQLADVFDGTIFAGSCDNFSTGIPNNVLRLINSDLSD